MKRIVKTVVERLTGAKVHADHTMIKGRKSGGKRDNNGKDWKAEQAGSTGNEN